MGDAWKRRREGREYKRGEDTHRGGDAIHVSLRIELGYWDRSSALKIVSILEHENCQVFTTHSLSTYDYRGRRRVRSQSQSVLDHLEDGVGVGVGGDVLFTRLEPAETMHSDSSSSPSPSPPSESPSEAPGPSEGHDSSPSPTGSQMSSPPYPGAGGSSNGDASAPGGSDSAYSTEGHVAEGPDGGDDDDYPTDDLSRLIKS
ncbi:hypothetical protein ACLB2K_061481 [Fragaria x ananassa]